MRTRKSSCGRPGSRSISRARLVDEHDAAAQQRHLRVRLEVGDLALEPVGQHDVVGVHAGDQRRLRQRAAGVEGHGQATRLLSLHADSRITLRRVGQDARRRVGRAVVDDDQLEVAQRLRQRRVERLAEKPLTVAHRHHDAHPGCHPMSSANSALCRSIQGARSKCSTARARARSRYEPSEDSTARTASASSPGAGGTSRSHVVSDDTPIPASADELGHAAARRVDDRHAAGERLEHDVRARVSHLGMEQDVRAPVERGSVSLRVAAGEVDAVGDAKLADQLLAPDHRAGHEQPRVGQQCQRAERRLQAIGLRLVAGEQQQRPAVRSALGRRELLRVDGVPQDLPRSLRRAEELVGRLLAELALVDDVRRRAQHARAAAR